MAEMFSLNHFEVGYGRDGTLGLCCLLNAHCSVLETLCVLTQWGTFKLQDKSGTFKLQDNFSLFPALVADVESIAHCFWKELSEYT
ncbi:hypothetical protein EK904_002323 [Melospiza melodia maxima]|nr:hypothetical protein EK904_002323 [Melospiza melodia maxima]